MCKFLVVVFWCLLVVNIIGAVPLSIVNNDISNSLEDGDEELAVIDDDITTHGLERLSSAATCLVAGVEYTHGQQIYRKDPCEFCLCLDGEMFCWWQDCPPTMEGPCRDRGPFSPCISVPSRPLSTQTTLPPTVSTTTTPANNDQQPQQQNTSSNADSTNTTENFYESSTYEEETVESFSSETPVSSTAEVPKTCTIMGRDYKIGDKLPHDTGNCIECICGQGAKVSCSPHQCSPIGDDINDYRPPGPRQPIPDVF